MKTSKMICGMTKTEFRKTVTDKTTLFNACWNKVCWFARNSEIDDLPALYESFVSEKVNNPRSRFYMHG